MIALIILYAFIALFVLVVGSCIWDDNHNYRDHQREARQGARMMILALVWPVLLVMLVPTFIEFLQKIWEDAGFAGNDED